MVKFAEADARLFKNRFVCKKCSKSIRASNMMVLGGKVKCRKCKYSRLRPKRKK